MFLVLLYEDFFDGIPSPTVWTRESFLPLLALHVPRVQETRVCTEHNVPNEDLLTLRYLMHFLCHDSFTYYSLNFNRIFSFLYEMTTTEKKKEIKHNFTEFIYTTRDIIIIMMTD